MIRAILVLLVSLASLTGATWEPGAIQPQLAAPVKVPFELLTRHIVVKGRVNNSRPLSFVLDTGANLAIVKLDVARELGLTLYGNVNAGGAGPIRQTGRLVRNANWTLAGLEGFAQPLTLALPLVFIGPGLGSDIDGIVGGAFIKAFVLELDYQAQQITLHDRKTFKYTGTGQTLPLEFTPDGHPVVKASVTPVGGKPVEQRFLLDIGSGAALILHTPFVAQQGLLASGLPTIRATGSVGAGGQTVGRLGRVSALQIGTFTIEEPITMFSQDQAGAFANPALAGNIGSQVASRFRTFFDYENRRIILEPSSTFADPFDRAFAGVAVRAEGRDRRTFRVDDVLENSPATEAGIMKDDVIMSVDGMAANTLTLTTLNELLEKPVSRRLTIKRGNKVLDVTLTPRRLI
jgi:hypothetical protein